MVYNNYIGRIVHNRKLQHKKNNFVSLSLIWITMFVDIFRVAFTSRITVVLNYF